jgi:hypothetical protein
LLAHGRWFFPGTPASSTTTTGRHDIAEILLTVALNTKKIKSNQSLSLMDGLLRKSFGKKMSPVQKICAGLF